jgi:uridine kinase
MTTNQLTEKLVADIEKKSDGRSLFIVGVSGLDASGKSQIADSLSRKLSEKGKNILSMSGDSFQFPREYKEDFQEKDWATQHMRRTINFQKMIDELLQPLQALPDTLQLDIVDYDTKEKVKTAIPLQYPLIVIIESIYLFSRRIMPYLNYKIFLDISIEEALTRATLRKRDLELYGSVQGIERKYKQKNFPGYLEFGLLEDPKSHADVLIDNNDWKNPVIIKDSL